MLRLATFIVGLWMAGPGAGFAQIPVPGGAPAAGTERPVDPRLVESMTLYKGFVAPPDRLAALKNLRLEVTSVAYPPKSKAPGQGEEKPEEGGETPGEVKNSFTLTLAFTPSFPTWKVRMDGTAKGQKLILVGTPGAKGQAFGVLGDPPVLQGHPVYAQRAHQMANQWASFVLRWLNPDLPLFRAEFESQKSLPEGRKELLILMGVRNLQGVRETAWRLHIDAATGQPISLDTFNPETFQLLEKMIFQGFYEAAGIRFPKICLLYNGKGMKTGEIQFESFQPDAELPAEIFEKPAK
ncbi:MAG: hypothetical protein ACE5H3_09700 [Planctomycetota bacterium]